jgi:hypothetical protein
MASLGDLSLLGVRGKKKKGIFQRNPETGLAIHRVRYGKFWLLKGYCHEKDKKGTKLRSKLDCPYMSSLRQYTSQ